MLSYRLCSLSFSEPKRGPQKGEHIIRMCFLFFFLGKVFFFFLAMLGPRFVRGLSLVAASGGHSSSRCTGLLLSWPLLLRGTGSRHTGSVVVAHRPSRSAACGILPDQGSNPRPLHWQADSQPLRHQGSPGCAFFSTVFSLASCSVTKNYYED